MSEPRRKFTIGPCLGRGGFGEVYRAVMRSAGGLDTEVAVKVLRVEVDPRSDAVRRLRDEGRILARLNHPTILRVHDLVTLEGRVALVMEFVEGADLGDCGPHSPEPIPIRAAVQVTGVVAEALAAAWETPGPNGTRLELVHRDIKPTNIRIGRHGEVKLLDFGIARSDVVDREASTDSNLVVGSLHYMGPERFLDRTPRPSSDVFGLGCCLYEAVAGEPFFGRGSMREVSAMAVDEGRYRQWLAFRLDRLPPQTPPAVKSLLEQVLAHEHERRPTAAALAVLCEDLAETLPGPSLKAWCRDRPWGAPGPVGGPLEGRVLTEGTLSLPDPIPEITAGAAVHREPVVTIDVGPRASGGQEIPPPAVRLPVPTGPGSIQDHAYTEDAYVRPPTPPPPLPAPVPAPVPVRASEPAAPATRRPVPRWLLFGGASALFGATILLVIAISFGLLAAAAVGTSYEGSRPTHEKPHR